MPEICESLLNFGFDLSETNKVSVQGFLCDIATFLCGICGTGSLL